MKQFQYGVSTSTDDEFIHIKISYNLCGIWYEVLAKIFRLVYDNDTSHSVPLMLMSLRYICFCVKLCVVMSSL